MTREEKSIAIEDLTARLADVNVVYLADTSGLDADTTSNLRRACFKAGIKLEVVKNTLLEKAMEASVNDYGDLPSVLKGNTALMISETANGPAKIIKEFRKKSDKPLLKGETYKNFKTIFDCGFSKLRAGIFNKNNSKEFFYAESEFFFDHKNLDFEIQ